MPCSEAMLILDFVGGKQCMSCEMLFSIILEKTKVRDIGRLLGWSESFLSFL